MTSDFKNLTPDDDPFSATDRIVRGYVTKTVRLFSKMRTQAQRQEDLYLIMQLISSTYESAWSIYRDCLSKTFSTAYKARWLKARDVEADAEFLAFITSYAFPEGYIPQKEWERKRDRCFESVASVWHEGKPIRAPVEVARNSVVRQLRQGADDMTTIGISRAFEDAGVKHVRWVTEKDARVCANCSPLDEKVFELSKLPPWPAHYNCRCHIVAVD